MNSANALELIIEEEAIPPKIVRVNKWSKINRIYKKFDLKRGSLLIWNGIVLSGSHTFAYYNLNNRERICIVHIQKLEKIHVDNHFEVSSKKSEIAIYDEMSRLRDLRITKLEDRPRNFNLFCQAFIGELEALESSNEVETSNIDYTPSISTTALPIMW